MMQPLSQARHDLIGQAWNSCEIPDRLNEAVIVPVPEKEDLHLPENYLMVSIISTCCKILTTVLPNRISSICEDKALLRAEQIGFCRMRSV